MPSIRNIALAVALVVGAGGPFLAATAFADPEIGGRFENQQDRIGQGYANGTLTRSEACRLERQEHELRREREHTAGNGLSDRERAELNRQLDRESGRIHADRTNDRDSGDKGRPLASLHC
jgi:hypothetical protein